MIDRQGNPILALSIPVLGSSVCAVLWQSGSACCSLEFVTWSTGGDTLGHPGAVIISGCHCCHPEGLHWSQGRAWGWLWAPEAAQPPAQEVFEVLEEQLSSGRAV